LLAEFSTLPHLLRADPARLAGQAADQRVVDLLRLVRGAMEACLKRRLAGPIIGTSSALIDYLHASMACRQNECARVLHLNARNILIRDEFVAEGSVDQVEFYIRELARRALELGSVAIILVHNHPSGDPSPSQRDIQFTREVMAALQPLRITVAEHIIVGSAGHCLMLARGLV
jgi:DNA repair protein RadC